MAFVRQTAAGPYKISRQPSTINQYDSPENNQPQYSNPEGLRIKAKELADSSNGAYTEDEAKYVIATNTAQDRFKDVADVDNERMKQEIDKIYEDELQASNTGREVRGENWFTDAVGGLKDLYNSGINAVGSGLDWVFDTAMEPVGLVSNDLKETLQNAFTGEDLAIIPDIAADVGLAAIPYAGIPLVAAKNAIQQSDDIAEAISGRDNITQQDLEGTQRLGKTASSLGAVGLSMIPGIGVTKNSIKHADDVAKAVKGLDEASSELTKSSKKITGDIEKRIAESGETPESIISDALINPSKVKGLLPESSIASVKDDALGFVDKTAKDRLDALKEAYPKAVANNKDVAINEAMKPIKEAQEALDAARRSYKGLPYKERLSKSNEKAAKLFKKDYDKLDKMDDAIDRLKLQRKDATSKADKKAIKEKIDKAKDAQKEYERHPILAARQFVSGVLPEMPSGQYARSLENLDVLKAASKDPMINSSKRGLDKATQWFKEHPIANRGANYLRNGAMLGGVAVANEMGETGVDPLTAVFQAGQRVATDPMASMAMLMPVGARGLARKYSPNAAGLYQSDMGYQALRAAAAADQLDRMSEYDIHEGYNEDELFNRLRTAIDRNNNG